jgi:hypothetical protein
VRLYDREPDEAARAFAAWTVYRDLGSDRSLRKAAEMLGKSEGYVGQLERWSSRFGWVDRARASDTEREMIARQAVDEHLRAEAEDCAAREVRIRKLVQEARLAAAERALKILQYPLLEQHGVRDEDGRLIELHFHPARWSLSTGVTLAQMAAGAGAGEVDLNDEPDAGFDPNRLSHEEVELWLELDAKATGRE